jgi:hypothetical protein
MSSLAWCVVDGSLEDGGTIALMPMSETTGRAWSVLRVDRRDTYVQPDS